MSELGFQLREGDVEHSLNAWMPDNMCASVIRDATNIGCSFVISIVSSKSRNTNVFSERV